MALLEGQAERMGSVTATSCKREVSSVKWMFEPKAPAELTA